MKKIAYLLLILSFFSIYNVKAKEIVTLNKCVDGDTAWFYLNNKEIKTRFLAIDTPESTNQTEPYGKEASEFTCNKLKTAKKIEIEYDETSDKIDKYDRHLVWVFVDGELLQDLIIKEGLGEVAYLYGDYKYKNTLKASQIEAQKQKINMWSNYNSNQIYLIIGIIIIIIIIYIFSSKVEKRLIKKIKKKIEKQIDKKIDQLLK